MGWAKVLELFDRAESGARLEVVSPPQFESKPEGMFRVTGQGEVLSRMQLTNYAAAMATSRTPSPKKGLHSSRAADLKHGILPTSLTCKWDNRANTDSYR
jgi:hypothetical protein